MPWSRASQLDRTLQCPGHLTLPHTRTVSEKAVDAANYGTMVHNWAETGVVRGIGPNAESHEKTFQKKLALLAANRITRENLWDVAGYHEVTFAYNCVDGRIGVCWLRDANATTWKSSYDKDWITGTADYVLSVDSEGRPKISDLKTGMLFDSQPDELSQLYFYLMCWSKYLHTEKDGILEVIHWPKYPLAAMPQREESLVPYVKLCKFEAYVKRLHSEAMRGNSPFVLGEECQYCPAQQHCSKYAEYMKSEISI